MGMSETELSRKCQKWVHDNNGHVLKIHGNAVQRIGEPDLIGAVWIKDIFYPFAIELKVGNNKPSENQLVRLKAWEKVGFCTGVAYSLEEFIGLILYHEGYISHERWLYAQD